VTAALPESALVRPAWAAPANVGALMSTRSGGVSTGALASLNLGRAVGDTPEAVSENRRRFAASLRGVDVAAEPPPARPVWLRQVHGVHVLELDDATPECPEVAADAAWTQTPGVACLIGAADCLPVLLAARDGRAVAAAHAGWRGLAAGVIEATVEALTRGAGVAPGELMAWLGPCIGPARFEVGAEVLHAFGVEPRERDVSDVSDAPGFRFAPRPDGAPRWLADLRGLARARLARLGVGAVSASEACTFDDESTFFSFRRDSTRVPASPSGRMAAAIWLHRAGGGSIARG